MDEDATLAAVAQRLADLLDLDHPPPERVAAAVLADPLYAHHLMTCKASPAFLRVLLANPPEMDTAPLHGNGRLVASAAKTLFRWAKAGFALVDDGTFTTRLAVCRACPDLVAPDGRLAYQILERVAPSDDERICRLCGCVAAKKARLPTENCPAPDAADPAVSRWGEPM
ncbi:hypothetical protein RHODGE_RHODGE_04062 [Rhodoplanes serenus]|uniref:Uncharacterized protein n=2 Tax=Nitrobacteraceae TaxID=41294 RepID=A0A3S5CYL0_9BRAD|nr:hypothetical protein RHODGE_RHODGE_04062 [Rhodoplanes serenus]